MISDRLFCFKRSDKEKLAQFLGQPDAANCVFFLYMSKQRKELYSLLSELLRKETLPLLVCLDSVIPLPLEKLADKFKIELGDDYLEKEDYEEIDDFCYRLTTGWYLLGDKLKEITLHQGINLGRVVEYEFQLFLIKRIKILRIIDAVIKKQRPSHLVIISDTADDLIGIPGILEKAQGVRIMTLLGGSRQARWAFMEKALRERVSDCITFLSDSMLKILLARKNKKEKILIDTRIRQELSRQVVLPDCFLFTPFEKGARLRLSLVRKGRLYFPFYFPGNFYFTAAGGFQAKFGLLEAEAVKQDIFNFQGLFVWEIIKPKLVEFFQLAFPRAVENIALFSGFCAKGRLKGIVLRHDLWELQRLCVELGRKFKIPTLVVQHGVFGEKGERIIFADKIAVWGKLCVETYQSFGNAASKCVVTGNPKHDAFYRQIKNNLTSGIHRQLRLDLHKDTILYLSEYSSILSSYTNRDRGEAAIILLIRMMMSELRDKQLIIKLHPYQNERLTREIFAYFNPKNVVLVKDMDLYALIKASGLVITKESSVGLKVMILEKPLIVINFEKRPDVVTYTTSGAALGVYQPQELAAAIERVFADNSLRKSLLEKSRRFASDYAYKIDGHSSRRVLNFILQETGLEFNPLRKNPRALDRG